MNIFCDHSLLISAAVNCVYLDGGVDVLAVNSNSDTHQHVLRSLGHFTVDLEQV